jgi:hypothetical protein
MPIIINKLVQFDKAIAAARESAKTVAATIEARFQKIERTIDQAERKLQLLNSKFDSAMAGQFGISQNEGEPETKETEYESLVPEFEIDSEGYFIVLPQFKGKMERSGYRVVGTISKDCQVLFKMRSNF